ncbi:HAMP domain-containing histidine kinase [bacterium]|nr:HAMP domain-containing histidine kinase [bacterium]
MRLRTKLLFAFLLSPVFLFVQSIRASSELRSIGQEVDNLDRYTQAEDLRSQVIVELLLLPDPQALEVNRARARDLVHAERALVLCRSLERRTKESEASRAVTRTEDAVLEYLAAMHALIPVAAEAGARAPFTPEGKRARQAWEQIGLVRGNAGPGPRAAQDALEPVAQEARREVFAIARRTDENAIRLVATGVLLALVLTVAAAFVLSGVTAQPILGLLAAARAVSRGKFEVSVPVKSRDEIGELSAAFNEMTRQLREVYQGLEDQVRERTEALRRREADLARERKLAAVGRLAAGVAHEVSNPLAVIAASAEGLRDRAKNDEELARVPGFQDFPAYLEQIEGEAYRLKRLVRRLLDFSRGGGATGAPARREALDLALVARDAVALAALDPRAKERPIDASGLDGASLELTGDEDELKEAVLNLIFNALDATEKNGGRVFVSAERREEPGGALAVLLVRDTGAGIERENLDRLFEPFFTTKPPGQGTGLGLALAYGACERHGGRLRASSEGLGRGATFAIELPLKAGLQ